MPKQRVYGQQVVVKLLDGEDSVAPIIIDFDKISVNKKVATQSFRTVGKSVTTHQSVFNGYGITLERTKRDDYLTQLNEILDIFQTSKRGNMEFMIERRIGHTFDISKIDPKKEFEELNVQNLRNSFIYDTLIKNALKFTRSAISPFVQQGLNQVASLQKQAQSFIKDVAKNPLVGTALDLYSDGRATLNREARFVEIQKFVCCVLTGFDDSVEAGNIYSESATFDSSLMLMGDNNGGRSAMYDYISQIVLRTQFKKQEEQQDYLKKAGLFLNNFDNIVNNVKKVAFETINVDYIKDVFTKGDF